MIKTLHLGTAPDMAGYKKAVCLGVVWYSWGVQQAPFRVLALLGAMAQDVIPLSVLTLVHIGTRLKVGGCETA